MAGTLSPEMATTLSDQNCLNVVDGLVEFSHLAAKTCQLVKLHVERLQLLLVDLALHRQEKQEHVVLGEALVVEDPHSLAVLHHGKGGEGRAGARGEEGVEMALAPPLLVPVQGLRLSCLRPLLHHLLVALLVPRA